MLAAAAPWPSALAQTVAPATPVAPPDEEVLQLSPFEVNADEDTGYAATQTLAGTRIRTTLDAKAQKIVETALREHLADIQARMDAEDPKHKRERRAQGAIVVIENIVRCLPNDGVLITGTPNKTAGQYASPQSAALHINQKSSDELRTLMQRYFHNVFMFGMNDEVLHTGYAPMCHYIWALAVGVRR